MVKDEIAEAEMTTEDGTTPNQGPADWSRRRYPVRVRNSPKFYGEEVQ